MAAHYGIAVIPDAHKNAINVVIALWQGEDPTESENISRPLNASSSADDPVTHWVGGRPYQEEELPIIQNLAANLPAASWPVQGVSGPVSEEDATAAATALYLMIGTAETYTSQLAQQTLASALGALDLRQVEEE
jgi:hypothetical protein